MTVSKSSHKRTQRAKSARRDTIPPSPRAPIIVAVIEGRSSARGTTVDRAAVEGLSQKLACIMDDVEHVKAALEAILIGRTM